MCVCVCENYKSINFILSKNDRKEKGLSKEALPLQMIFISYFFN